MDSQKLISVSGFVVMFVWVFTIGSAVFTNKYEPMQVSTPVMVIYAGFIFAKNVFGKQERDDQKRVKDEKKEREQHEV